MSTITLEYHETAQGRIQKGVLEFSQKLLKKPYALESLFVIKVEGESMQPKINDQALVVADVSQELLKKPYALESLFVIKVEGESMQPKINDQALVVADVSQKEFEHNKIYLVFYEEKMWIKQAKEEDGKKLFVSINPEFSHLVYDFKDVRVIAKALLTFTTL